MLHIQVQPNNQRAGKVQMPTFCPICEQEIRYSMHGKIARRTDEHITAVFPGNTVLSEISAIASFKLAANKNDRR
ncbi:hypothetical protein EG68_08411 [Paragonimus skrjabini miyazakii]|uniref:Uncharacterized protein n=1 Tax=Paragonimus skrjabini miyazakii TaxID=59628 RepID=A0A8S9YJH0_9TREM|nr:hypothetical protein EG68_08411 [Paragonimus skrjabini miyazakii]